MPEQRLQLEQLAEIIGGRLGEAALAALAALDKAEAERERLREALRWLCAVDLRDPAAAKCWEDAAAALRSSPTQPAPEPLHPDPEIAAEVAADMAEARAADAAAGIEEGWHRGAQPAPEGEPCTHNASVMKRFSDGVHRSYCPLCGATP